MDCKLWMLAALLALHSTWAAAAVTGGVFSYDVKPGDNLVNIGARFGAEARALARANSLGEKAIIKPGQKLTVDNSHIVPDSIDEGVLINVPQRMLYLFHEGEAIASYPVGLGKPSWPTPTGEFKILSLEKNKCWCVPQSIQDEMRRQGKKVVTRVPPGPDNPLGGYWIGLSMPGFGIHGTIAPSSIYRFQSHCCVRMHPEAIAQLFTRVQKGMSGRLIYAPVMIEKLADGRVLAEVHPDIYNRNGSPLSALWAIAGSKNLPAEIDWDKAADVAAQRQGTPQDIGFETRDSHAGRDETKIFVLDGSRRNNFRDAANRRRGDPK